MRSAVAILGCFLLFSAGGAARAASPAPLAVAADPASLVLGRDAGTALSIEGPAEMPEPRLSANVGTVEGLAKAAPGRWTARYVPPARRYPQVAIVAALAGERVGWLAIPLFGQGEAVIKARPRARIDAVRIGDRTFGPAVADEKGDCTVPVIVPPGITQAYNGPQAIDLGLPQTVHLHLALDRESAAADQPQAVRGYVFAVTHDGAPREKAPIVLSASRGEAALEAPIAPGVTPLTWRLGLGAAETIQLEARLEDEPDFARTAALARGAGRPARFTLEVDRPRWVAGEPALLARAVAADAAGNPVGPRFALETSFGAVEAPREVGPGRFEAKLQIPSRLEGRAALELRAVAEGGLVLATIAVPLAPASASVALEPAAAALEADGRSTVALRARAADAFGNPPAQPPAASARLGTVAARATAPGEWALDYTAPARREAGEDVVTFAADGGAATARVALAPKAAALELAPKLGFIGDGVLAAPWIAAEAGLRFDARGQTLALMIEVAWYRFSTTEALESGEERSGRHDLVSPLLSVGWRRAFGQGKWALQISAGVGITSAWTRLGAGDRPDLRQQSIALAYEATVGIQRSAWRGGPLLELRYARHTDLGATGLRDPLESVLLALGYRFEAL